jgi:hypothetical protein
MTLTKSTAQTVNNMWISGQLTNFTNAIFRHVASIIGVMQAILIHFSEVQNIDGRVENGIQSSTSWMNASQISTIDSSDGNSITREDGFSQRSMNNQSNCVLSLAGMLLARNFLQLDDLLVDKERAIVDELEAMIVVAFRTVDWLLNATAFDFNFDLEKKKRIRRCEYLLTG